MNLLGSTKNKITEDRNSENIPQLEITEVVLVHCNIVNNIIYKIQEYYIRLFQIKSFVVY